MKEKNIEGTAPRRSIKMNSISNFPETPNELKAFLDAITPMQVEHIFLDALLWANSSIRVTVAYAYSEFENENYLILSLYDVRSRKALAETVMPAGLDVFTGRIMTTIEAEDFDATVAYENTKVWLQPAEDGKIFLLAKRGTEKKEFVLNGLEAYS
jgi:hypothetical protein